MFNFKLLRPPIFNYISKKNIIPYLFQFLGIKRTYNILGVDILLPPKHKLDTIRNTFKLYDRYFAYLAQVLNKDELVVDVGANIGDTAIPFLKNGLTVVCVEPSNYFFSYLELNLKDYQNTKNKAILFNNFITTSDESIELVIHEGTAFTNKLNNSSKPNLVENLNNKSIALDDLIIRNNFDLNLGLIKIDTDGFDYDVLKSGLKIISEKKPILFFENQITTENVQNYNHIYENLNSLNYKLVAFDNEGYILSTNFNFSNIHSINEYLIKTNFKAFHYIDLLAYTEKDESRVFDSISKYRSAFYC